MVQSHTLIKNPCHAQRCLLYETYIGVPFNMFVSLFSVTKARPGVIIEIREDALYFLGTEHRFYFLNQVCISRQKCFLDNAQLRISLLRARTLSMAPPPFKNEKRFRTMGHMDKTLTALSIPRRGLSTCPGHQQELLRRLFGVQRKVTPGASDSSIVKDVPFSVLNAHWSSFIVSSFT